MQFLLQFLAAILFVIASLAAIAGLPLWLGNLAGRRVFARLPNWTSFIPGGCMMAWVFFHLFFVSPHLTPAQAQWDSVKVFSLMFAAMFFTAGTMFDRNRQRFLARSQKQLAGWQARLSKDTESGNHTLEALDQERLGSLHASLGHKEEAVASYKRAYELLNEEFGDHPQVRTVLAGYVNALRAVNQTEEAARLEEQLKTITSPDDVY